MERFIGLDFSSTLFHSLLEYITALCIPLAFNEKSLFSRFDLSNIIKTISAS